MTIADNPLEERFFMAGDNLAAASTTQFDLPTVADERRRRGLKALIVTGAILVVAVVLLGLLLPAPSSTSAHREPERGAQL
ncbi:MAG TPA: hypothetical protein VIG06_10545 [Kofleriaceae bacterium]